MIYNVIRVSQLKNGVLPSYREGRPHSLLEAMAVGRAIITKNVSGSRETVVDGHNEYLIPVNNVIDLSEAMEKFIHNPFLSQEMRLKSRQLAEENLMSIKVNRFVNTQLWGTKNAF